MPIAPRLTLTLLSGLGAAWAAAQTPPLPVTALEAAARPGQVFLTWSETGLPSGATLAVYSHTVPITSTTLAQARCLARQIDAGSARDWWQDPASFTPGAAPGMPSGWRLDPDRPPLDPRGGLFVHTVTPETAGPRYYAVTWSTPEGREQDGIQPGANATTAPLAALPGQPLPLWQGQDGALPAAQSARGRRLVLSLHGRGGGITAGPGAATVNCLWFGDATQGWREGLAFKFALTLQPDTVVITPMDRTWIGRPVLESKDVRDHCPAINTWWFGYNQRIRETILTETIVAPNYTECYLLALVRWAQAYLGCEAQATYVRGGSMGGSGAVALALHFPQVFAAAYAQVPVYACTRLGRGTTVARLECFCGPLDGRPATTVGGVPILEYFDGPRGIATATVDTPPIFATNGRQDGSIPWENNPPFYAAATRARQAFAVYWNNGNHGMSNEAPADVKAWGNAIFRYRLDQSYPAFSDSSDNRAYGHGNPQDGDLVGWLHRGLDWKDLEETASTYALTLLAGHPDLVYPVTLAVTPRRRQAFRPAPGEVLDVTLDGHVVAPVTVDAQGQFTVPGIVLAGPAGVRLAVHRR